MPGRFEGMSDAEWELVEDIFPDKAKKSRGMPAAHSHNILNLLLFILVTGCRWCDLPRGGQEWKAQAWLLGAAQNEGMIFWKSGAVDSSFSLRKRRCTWI